ncbi:hypothetical protein HK099_006807 [Clydaea vesicula]|uniref:F-box domain-containing protein n=1 Tax=Clydaea vesicula TaxID=447962 RepID=A0AAD5Y2E9_9FUNG|nr:hypothetical protein HK099_006807 [Clydaea vesicula]KAJ3393930.1 hypothetical protein HDU92_007410 [Lobulomyces angularis]
MKINVVYNNIIKEIEIDPLFDIGNFRECLTTNLNLDSDNHNILIFFNETELISVTQTISEAKIQENNSVYIQLTPKNFSKHNLPSPTNNNCPTDKNKHSKSFLSNKFDVLSIIISLLSKNELFNCCLVSKAWHTIAVSQIWKSVVIYSENWDLIKPIVTKANDNYKKLIQRFILKSSNENPLLDTKPHQLRRVLEKSTNLTVISLNTPSINDDDIWVISMNCKHLSIVNFFSVDVDYARITDEGLQALSNCRMLKMLFIRSSWIRRKQTGSQSEKMRDPFQSTSNQNFAFTDWGFKKLLDSFCGRLLGFGLEWTGGSCSPSDGEDSAVFYSNYGTKLADVLKDLFRLNLNLQEFYLDWPLPIESVLEHSSNFSKNLKKIKIGNAQKVDALIKIVNNNHNLQYFSLYELNATVDPTVLLEPFIIDTPKHNLPTMDVNSFNENYFSSQQSVFSSPASLASSFSSSFYSTPTSLMIPVERKEIVELELDGVGFISNLLTSITKFSYLKRLIISPSRRAATLHHFMTDDLVGEVAKHCQQLIYLQAPIVGDAPLVKVAENLKNLEYIDLVSGREISDAALILLSKKCVKLKDVFLGSAVYISDNAISVLARSLNLTLNRFALPFGNQRITSRSLNSLTENCLNLEKLTNLPASIEFNFLFEKLPRLKKLIILGVCQQINLTGRGISYSRLEQDLLKGKCKRLKQIVFT